MKAIILKVSQKRISKNGGEYIRTIFKNIENDNNEKFIFDCYLKHPNSKRFEPFLKEQAIFDNLSIIIHNNKKVIDGNSNFKYLGQRHDK